MLTRILSINIEYIDIKIKINLVLNNLCETHKGGYKMTIEIENIKSQVLNNANAGYPCIFRIFFSIFHYLLICAFNSSSFLILTITPPASLLWIISGDIIFITKG